MNSQIDPLVDFACKQLLGNPAHPSLTMHFLNAVLNKSPRISDVEILNPIVEKEFEDDKYSIFDVKARNTQGDRFNIEIQRTRPAGLAERLAYYVSCQLIEQIGAGQRYKDLRPSIGICILNAIQFPTIDDFVMDFRFLNPKHGQVLTDHLQIHLLELPKYQPPSDNVVISTPIEQWCYFFRKAQYLPREELLGRLRDPIFAEAIGVLEMIARDPEQRRLYEDRLKFERDVQAKEDAARQEGEATGKIKGEAIGKVKGEAIGKVKGEAIGKIKLLLELLGEPAMDSSELDQMLPDALSTLEQSLQRRLRERS